MDKTKDTKKEYRLSFYESGYIIPEEYELREFSTDCCKLKVKLYKTNISREELDKILDKCGCSSTG